MKFVYLHGFASGPGSTKARYFAQQFAQVGIALTVPALDDGDFERLTISRQLEVVRRATAGEPAVLLGSSMGGYVAALYAARHPEVQRLVLLAPAFCFARRWESWLGWEEMERWRETGSRTFYHYAQACERKLLYGLIEDGLKYEDFPVVKQPTLVLHGTRDEVVPVSLSEQFARNHPAVRLVHFDSGHELTDVTARLWAETAAFLELPGGVTGRAQV